jgi:intraflagellar transport protein 88
MGNVHFEQGKYPSAIKMYRMALDALPPSAAYQRARLMTNIGLAFVQLGQYADAASTFESALDMAPDHQVSGVDSSWCFGMKEDTRIMGRLVLHADTRF